MSQTMLALISPETDERPYGPLLDVAHSIHQQFRRQGVISRQALQKLMTQSFGRSDASGAWSMRDAYEALEAAQVLLLRDPACAILAGSTPQERFRDLHDLERALPTQTYRSEPGRASAVQHAAHPRLADGMRRSDRPDRSRSRTLGRHRHARRPRRPGGRTPHPQ